MARTPANGSDGPMARTIIFLGCVPVIMNPPIRTLSAVSTRKRVEMFPNVLGGGLGVGVALGVGVGVGLAGGVGVGVDGGGVGVAGGAVGDGDGEAAKN